LVPLLERAHAMEHEGVGGVQAEPLEAFPDLSGDGAVEVVDLVDDEDARAASSERGAHDALAVAILVARRRIDQVEPEVEGSPQRGDERVERDCTIGDVTDADARRREPGATELAIRREARPAQSGSPENLS